MTGIFLIIGIEDETKFIGIFFLTLLSYITPNKLFP